MAKRANPYIEDFVQQSKVHVGIKQFNNNKDRLQKVYEKTLQLLFNGAKKIPSAEVTNLPVNVSHDKRDRMKQLAIGRDGTLIHSDIVVSNKPASVQRCRCGDTTVEAQCAYCETTLCSSCQHFCAQCERTYCTHCSLTGYEDAEVCVSCYG